MEHSYPRHYGRSSLPLLGNSSSRALEQYRANRQSSPYGSFDSWASLNSDAHQSTVDDNLLGNLPTPKKPQAKPSDAVRVDVTMDPKLLQMGGEECNINTRATFEMKGTETVGDLLYKYLNYFWPDYEFCASLSPDLTLQRIEGFDLDPNCPMWVLFCDKPSLCELVVSKRTTFVRNAYHRTAAHEHYWRNQFSYTPSKRL